MEKLAVPEAGTAAPEFVAKNQKGETVKLANYRGKKVVLYFYPKDDTPGCTKEACSLRDNYGEITKRGAVVLGVSSDGETSHQNFAEKYTLPFDLIVDEDMAIIRKYGAYGEKNMYGKIVKGVFRYSFVIDESGIIKKVFKKVKTDTHGEEVLNHI